MGYLICDQCGGYYELQPGEKAEDFSDECECGGRLFYSETLEFPQEVQVESDIPSASDELDIQVDSDIQNESSVKSESDTSTENINEDHYEEDEFLINETASIEDDKAALRTKSKREEIKHATELHDILATKGYYMVIGRGVRQYIKILPEGIENNDGQFIRFENIRSIEKIQDTEDKPDNTPKKSGIGGLIVKARKALISRNCTIKIVFDNGEIQLKNVKKHDAERSVSFIKRMIK